MSLFETSKKEFKTAFNQIIKEGKEVDNYKIDEAALPAYAHKNPLIDWLFWKRIKVAYNFAINQNNCEKVLDFGCGSGILSYLLAKNNFSVTSCDIEFKPLNFVKNKINFPSTIEFIEGDILTKDLPEKSFDMIFAMDVLEHIDNLEPYIKLFERLLKPTGFILVSGPSENIFYKIGRKIAGNRFTGDYHVTNITIIKKAFQPFLNVSTLKKLLFPVILFEIFIASKK